MRQVYHPNAWLPNFRNIKPGLKRRTEILRILEKRSEVAKHLSRQIEINYSTTLYHLHNLERKGIIKRVTSKPPYVWESTLVGQQKLNNY